MRSHIASIKLQVDLQALVAKDLLLLAEDGIREGGVEGLDLFETRFAGAHQRDIESLIGIDDPWGDVSQWAMTRSRVSHTLFVARHGKQRLWQSCYQECAVFLFGVELRMRQIFSVGAGVWTLMMLLLGD